MDVNVIKTSGTKFFEINVGEIFGYEDEDFYMKIEKRSDCGYNAVSVYNGLLYIFDNDEEVIKVKSSMLDIEI